MVPWKFNNLMENTLGGKKVCENINKAQDPVNETTLRVVNNCSFHFVGLLIFLSHLRNTLLEFFPNVFTDFAEFSDKNICHYSKRA